MLLLVTIVLVLIAAVTLLIGIFSDELALIFVSIGASALAAIVLAVLSQVSRRKGRTAAEATGPEPLPQRQDVATQAAESIETLGEPVAVPVTSDAPTETVPVVAATPAARGGSLPIEDYDSLRVNEILPRLDGLDLDQLEDVAQHEESHKNRTTVLNRIDQLMDELEAAPAGAPVSADQQLAEEAAASIEEIGEPVVALEDVPSAPEPAAAEASPDGFPIPNYDALEEDELIPLLDELDADELEQVADREEAGKNRDAVLDAIDDRLDILEGIVPAPPARAAASTMAETEPVTMQEPEPAPVMRVATAKKAPSARKAAATPTKKGAAVKKAAAPARAAKKAAAPVPTKSAAKVPARSAAKKAAATPVTARKAGAATAKKSVAKAAPVTRKAATAVKKATPVKKAAAAKKASKR